MSTPYPLHSVFGIELEYMIVHRTTLHIMPISDFVLKELSETLDTTNTNHEFVWSHTLVNHVLVLKTQQPRATYKGLNTALAATIAGLNARLQPHDALLLPTAAHPFMDPLTQTNPWPGQQAEVYRLYNRMYNCSTHGWCNLQGMRLNLPFADDADFEKLYAAIRMVLPIIPALAASSPILDGVVTPHKDARLWAYIAHRKQLPALMSSLIPEQAFSRLAYTQQVLNPIQEAIRPYNQEKILDKNKMNWRGAVARLDRGYIEVRLSDMQECPKADLAIAELLMAVIKSLTTEKSCGLLRQKSWHGDDLRSILHQTIKDAEYAVIKDSNYLHCMGMKVSKASGQDIWQFLVDTNRTKLSKESFDTLQKILNNGTLSSRIVERAGKNPTHQDVVWTYADLADCLATNTLYM